MTVRAMTKDQAEFVLKFTKEGTVQRHCDLVKLSKTEKTPFLFMMGRAKKVSRGKYDFTKAREAAQAVVDGKADPTAPVKAVKAPKTKTKAKTKVKAKTKSKGKITTPKAKVEVKVEAPAATETVTS